MGATGSEVVKEDEQQRQSNLNLARHLTVDLDSILIWMIRKQGLGHWTIT